MRNKVVEDQRRAGSATTSSREPTIHYLDSSEEEEILTAAHIATYLEEVLMIFNIIKNINKEVKLEVPKELGSSNLNTNIEYLTDRILVPFYITTERTLSRVIHLGHLIRIEALKAHGHEDSARILYQIMRNNAGYNIILDGSVLIMLDRLLIKSLIKQHLEELLNNRKEEEIPINRVVEGVVEAYHRKLCEKASEKDDQDLAKYAYIGLAIQYILPEPPMLTKHWTIDKCEKERRGIKDIIKINKHVKINYEELVKKLADIANRMQVFSILYK